MADDDAGLAAGADLMSVLYAELDRIRRCRMVWVMDPGWYKRIRRHAAAVRPQGEPEDDEAKWAPSADDLMFGYSILVREDGGKPHIEWLTREELASAWLTE